MWKESYRLGVDVIDKQHKDLFEMATNLIVAVQKGTEVGRNECMAAVNYLRDYTLQHFKDEEDYQKSIGYVGLAEHKKIHQDFVVNVIKHERKMTLSNFSETDVKDFLGTLIAWLVYHVAGDDQMIVLGNKPGEVITHAPVESFFSMNTWEVLNTVAGLNRKNIREIEHAPYDLQPTISTVVNVTGDLSGPITYKFTSKMAFALMQNMIPNYPPVIDEMICSAMMELSHIITIKSVGQMWSLGYSCNTGLPSVVVDPAFLPSQKSNVFETGMGMMEIDVALK